MYLYSINFISITILLCIISKSSGDDNLEKTDELLIKQLKDYYVNLDQYKEINKKSHTSLQTLFQEQDAFEECINTLQKSDNKLFKNIKFQYWSRTLKNETKPYKYIDFHNVKSLLQFWMKDTAVKIIIHGWQRPRGAFTIKDAYVESTEFNVITMDWSNTSSKLNYVAVANFIFKFGTYLGFFLTKLVKYKIVKPSHIHVIGHSLGAHIAGVSGKVFEHFIHQKISHITGLDPSRPTFDGPSCISWNNCSTLVCSAAEFVDVMHTAGGFFGIKNRMGHVDFYPNNGKSPQPHCRKYFLPIKREHCSHSSGYLYYSISVSNPKSFESVKCSSMKAFKNGECNDNDRNYMGNDVNFSSRGKFFLTTNPDFPHYKNLPQPSQE